MVEEYWLKIITELLLDKKELRFTLLYLRPTTNTTIKTNVKVIINDTRNKFDKLDPEKQDNIVDAAEELITC